MSEISEMKEDSKQEFIMPVIPLRGITILPGTVIHFDLNREKTVQAEFFWQPRRARKQTIPRRRIYTGPGRFRR